MWLITSLITTIMVMGGFLVFLLYLGKNEILSTLKVKLGKGYSYVFLLGEDNRIYLDAKKYGGKKKDTAITEINNLPYYKNNKKIKFYKNAPALLYAEGCSEPLDIQGEGLESSKLTPEMFKQAIIVARQSGQMPENEKLQQLKDLAIFVAAGAGVASLILIFMIRSDLGTMMPQLQSLLQMVRGFVGG